MRSWLVAVVGLAVLGCGTPSPSASPGSLAKRSSPPIAVTGVPAKVHVDAPKATAAWIGPAGGTLTTTAKDGTVYELEIPKLAVPTATAITMTPITGIDDLGLSGGLAGAVFLQPAGLELAAPATLAIASSRAAPAGTRLVGFDVPDDGGATELIPAFATGSRVSVLVFHFSAPGAAFGTSQDLAQQGGAAGNSTRLAGLLSTLLAYPVPWDMTTKGVAGLLIDTVWAAALRPELVAITTDAALLRAIKDWRTFVFVLNLFARNGAVTAALADGEGYAGGVRPSHTAAFLDGQGLLEVRIGRAIDGNEALCDQSHDLAALANMWFWAGVGERYAPTSTDWPAKARGCAEVVVATFNAATNLQAGGSDSLGLVFQLKFSDGVRVPADFEVTLHGTRFTFASTGGADMTAGVAAGSTLTAGVFAQQGPPYTLSASACWSLDGLMRNLCGGPFQLPFGSGPTTAPPSQPPQPSGAAGLAQQIAGTYSVRLLCANTLYGEGTAKATASGTTVSLTWSVSIKDPGTNSGGQCGDAMRGGRFPTSGSYSGTIFVQPNGAIDIMLSSWQVSPCVSPSAKPPTSAGYFPSLRAIGIPVGSCVPSALFGSMGYSTAKTGP